MKCRYAANLLFAFTSVFCCADSAKPLSAVECSRAFDGMWRQYVRTEKPQLQKEWDDRCIRIGGREMRFEYRVFGSAAQTGRDLFISMHGGGGTTKEINDSQWRNQTGLYTLGQGLYVAPRAPTDAWNMWHQEHIDVFFARLIEGAVLCMGANPDRVYIMGYSAGGDGVYQLAPRLADRLAAAAMMAGHPNEASPLGLRNIGFTIHVGELDSGYNRNKVALEWKQRLEKLRLSDPAGYAHKVVVHSGMGHWMNRQDAEAIEWMTGFTRSPYPKKVVWQQDDVLHPQFYWLEVPEDEMKARSEITAEIRGQEITLASVSGVRTVCILLNDRLVNMDQPVKVIHQGRVLFNGRVFRTLATVERIFRRRHDRRMIFCGEISVELGGPTASLQE